MVNNKIIYQLPNFTIVTLLLQVVVVLRMSMAVTIMKRLATSGQRHICHGSVPVTGASGWEVTS